jgi:hypothetical protein
MRLVFDEPKQMHAAAILTTLKKKDQHPIVSCHEWISGAKNSTPSPIRGR